MPASYQIFSDEGFVVARYWGDVTLSDVTGILESYQADPGFRADLPFLVDLSEMRSTSASFGDISAALGMFNRAYSRLGTTTRMGFCAPSGLSYGMARMFVTLASMSDRVRASVHRDLDEARAWVLSSDRIDTD